MKKHKPRPWEANEEQMDGLKLIVKLGVGVFVVWALGVFMLWW